MGSCALTDEFLAIAHNVEAALLQAGAKPGTDYTCLDLFRLAQPVVVSMFGSGRINEWDYPASKVIGSRATSDQSPG